MTQNRSSAVMQQRRDRAKASLDDFPTPPWATRACVEHVLPAVTRRADWRDVVAGSSATDPCCNRGHMVRPLAEVFGQVRGTDIADYTGDRRRALSWGGDRDGDASWSLFHQDGVGDFLLPSWEATFARAAEADWFFMNPPFKLAEAFILKALELAREGVAVFIRSAFPEGVRRYEQLFRDTPPTAIAYFAERVILHEGVLRDPEIPYWDGEGWRTPSTATGSIWMVWVKQEARSGATGKDRFAERVPPIWIPPCRKLLTRPCDYPVNPDQKGVFVPAGDPGQGGLAL